jgi:hypothetical protein
MFEARTYNQVRKSIGVANCIFALLILIVAYTSVLSQNHLIVIKGIAINIKDNPLVTLIPVALVISTIWAYFSTVILRLHDRFYEPIFIKWRASYETDFILRSICREFPDKVSERFFNEVYFTKRKRDSWMYRLFYSFVGDWKEEHQGLIERFYTLIRNYWIIGLAELYSLVALLAYSIYAIVTQMKISPVLVFILLLLVVCCRVLSNHILDQIRPITSEQIRVILSQYREQVKDALCELSES